VRGCHSFGDARDGKTPAQCNISKPDRDVGAAAFFPARSGACPPRRILRRFDVASSLASQGGYDVALVDASLNSPALHTELGLTSPGQDESGWPIAPHLWLVDRGHWLPEGNRNITSGCVLRLREVLSEFDFSVLRYGAASSLSTNMAKACDGIVLVLAANKTRRLVAAQIKEQILQAQIPLLGSILADRKFPVPHSLYRNL
jgi:hypothetical protein